MKSKPDSAAKPISIRCLKCGYVGLPTNRGTCARCDAWLDLDKYARLFSHRPNLPILFIFYLFLLWLCAITSACSAIIGLLEGHGILVFFMLSGMALLSGLTAFGLLYGKKWGRDFAILLLGLGIVVNGFVSIALFFSPITRFFNGLSAFSRLTICGSIIGIPIQGYMLCSLWDNGHRFT